MRRAVGAMLLLARAAVAQPVLDAGAVPGLTDAGRRSYADFLAANLPRAYATDGKGNYGWSGGRGTLEAMRASAMEGCQKRGSDCHIYAENLDVVWGGRATQAAAPPGPLASTWNYAVVPDNRYFWRGPAAAAGVYVWAHGYNGEMDSRGLQPQGHVRAFNNAGFDVVRFDRETRADSDRYRVAGWLQDVLAELRRRGYRKVVVGGQSRGAWNALMMLEHPGLADAVVAISPAAHGSGASTNLSAQYDDLRQLLNDVPVQPTRVAFVQFAADPFAGDSAGRRALIERVRGRLGALLVIDQPDGLRGHGAGQSAQFATRFGPCLLRLVQDTSPPAAC